MGPVRGVSEWRWAAVPVGLVALPMIVLGCLRYRLQMPLGDEPHYLVISQALRRYGSLDVQQVYDHRDYWSYYPRLLEPHVAPGPDGRPLPLHSIGGPLLWLVPFALWGRAGVIAFMTGVSLLIVVNVFRLNRELGVGRSVAVLVATAFGLGTPVLTYASMSFVEPIGALGCLYALRIALRDGPRRRDLLIVSTVLGALPWVHSRFLLFPAVFLTVLVLRELRARRAGRRARLACALAPAVVLFAGLEAYDWLLWGTLDLAPNQVSGDAVPFRRDPGPALLGTVLDQEVGVIPNFPIFLFVLPGLLFARRFATMNVTVFAAVIPYTLVVCSFPAWDGAWSPPARFAAVVLPLLAGYVGLAVARVRSGWSAGVALVLAAAAAVLTVAAVWTPSGGFSAQGGRNPTLQMIEAHTHLTITGFLPSSPLAGQALLFASWSAGLLVFATAVWWAARGRENRSAGGHRTPDMAAAGRCSS